MEIITQAVITDEDYSLLADTNAKDPCIGCAARNSCCGCEKQREYDAAMEPIKKNNLADVYDSVAEVRDNLDDIKGSIRDLKPAIKYISDNGFDAKRILNKDAKYAQSLVKELYDIIQSLTDVSQEESDDVQVSNAFTD